MISQMIDIFRGSFVNCGAGSKKFEPERKSDVKLESGLASVASIQINAQINVCGLVGPLRHSQQTVEIVLLLVLSTFYFCKINHHFHISIVSEALGLFL